MKGSKFHVKRGDTVEVITGVHKGVSGKVLQVLPKKSQVLVEGVRMISKHSKKSEAFPQGGIIQREGPLHISNVRRIEKADSVETPAKGRSRANKLD